MLAGLPSSASLTPQFPLLLGLKPTPPISHRRLPGEATGRHPAGSRGKESGGSLRAPRVGRMRAGRAGKGRAKLGRAGQGRVRASRWAPSPDPQQGPAVTAITAGTLRPPPPAAAASPRGPDPAPAPTLPAGWEHPAGTAGPGSGPTSAPGSAQGAGEGRWAGGPLPHPLGAVGIVRGALPAPPPPLRLLRGKVRKKQEGHPPCPPRRETGER